MMNICYSYLNIRCTNSHRSEKAKVLRQLLLIIDA